MKNRQYYLLEQFYSDLRQAPVQNGNICPEVTGIYFRIIPEL